MPEVGNPNIKKFVAIFKKKIPVKGYDVNVEIIYINNKMGTYVD